MQVVEGWRFIDHSCVANQFQMLEMLALKEKFSTAICPI